MTPARIEPELPYRRRLQVFRTRPDKKRYITDMEPSPDVSTREALLHLDETLGLPEPEIAGALEVSWRTLERWRSGEGHPQRAASLRLAKLLVLARRLEETFAGGGTEEWLRTDNRYLGGMKPSEAIRAGRVNRVEAALEALDAGIFL